MEKIKDIDYFIEILDVIKELSLDDEFEQNACDDLIRYLLSTCSCVWVNYEIPYSDKKTRTKFYNLLVLTGRKFFSNLEK